MARSRHKSPRIPTSTHLHVVEDAPSRLVVHIPGGGPRAAGLGCFALLWNLFLLVITGVMVPAFVFGQNKPDAPGAWFMGSILSLFWLVGLGMAYFWMRMRFTRYNLLVEPRRIVVQKSLFDRQSIEETRIDADSSVDLVEKYQQNDVPVHAVAISGADRTIEFGTALSDQDKRFLVRKMRLVTGLQEPTEEERQRFVREFPGNCVACGAPLPTPEPDAAFVTCSHCGRTHGGSTLSAATTDEDSLPFDDLEPFDLPSDSLVVVQQEDGERLAIAYPAFDPKWRWPAAGIVAFVSLFFVPFLVVPFMVGAMFLGGGFGWIALVVGAVLCLGGPILVAASVWRSRVHVALDGEELEARWQVGPLKIRRSLPIQEVRQVVLSSRADDDQPLRRGNRRTIHIGPGRDSPTCIISSTSKRIPVTAGLNQPTSRQVAGLIRGRLRKLGCQV